MKRLEKAQLQSGWSTTAWASCGRARDRGNALVKVKLYIEGGGGRGKVFDLFQLAAAQADDDDFQCCWSIVRPDHHHAAPNDPASSGALETTRRLDASPA